MCSKSTDTLILHIEILYQFISSDHKPMHIKFNDLYGELVDCRNSSSQSSAFSYDWSAAGSSDIINYQRILHELLRQINIPLMRSQNDVMYNNKIIGAIDSA